MIAILFEYQQEVFNIFTAEDKHCKAGVGGQQEFGQTTLFLSVTRAQHWPPLVTQFTGPRHIICEAIPVKTRMN